MVTTIFVLINTFAHHLSIKIGLKFILFEFFCLLIPGLAVSKALKIKINNFIELSAYSTAFGILVQMAEYFALVPFGLKRFSSKLSVIIGIFAITFLIQKKISEKKVHKQIFNINEIKAIDILDIIVFLVALAFLYLICIYTVSYTNTLPNENGGNTYYQDWLYYIGNSESLMKGFPPQVACLHGTILNYHYFSNILVAQMAICTKIDIVMFSFYYSFYLPLLFLLSSVFFLSKQLIKGNVYQYLSIFLSLFAFGQGIKIEWQLYFCPLGSDYGMALFLFIYALLVKMYKDKKFSLKGGIITSIFFMMLTGTKAPFAASLLLILFIFSIYELKNKNYKIGITNGLLWLISFFLIFIFIVGGFSNISSQSENAADNPIEFVGFNGAVNNNFQIYESGTSHLFSKGFSDTLIVRILGALMYLLKSNLAAFVLSIFILAVLLYKIIKKHNLDILLLCSMVVSLFGVIIVLNTKQTGNSQEYFLLISFPLSVITGCYALEKYSSKKIIFIIMNCIIIYCSAYGVWNTYNKLKNPFEIGKKALIEQVEPTARYIDSYKYKYLSEIRDTIPDNAIICLDTYGDNQGNPQDFMIQVFTEKYVWFDMLYCPDPDLLKEREKVNDKLLSGDYSQIENMKKGGVGYYIVSRDVHYDFTIPETYAELLMEDNNYRFYRFK